MKVLVIEDEHLIAQSIKKGLEQELFSVDVAFNGIDGYDLAASEHYDVILLDLMLPGMDGLTICQKLRQDKNHVPILMLTARGQVDDKVLGLNRGADDYLAKPFSFEELLARIKAITRRPANIAPNMLVVGDVTLNPNTYQVTKRKTSLKLSSREFSLLEYLMRNVGVILTKERIISHLWNYDQEVLPNTVEVYIRNIRQKIGNDYVETHRGFGYRFVDPCSKKPASN